MKPDEEPKYFCPKGCRLLLSSRKSDPNHYNALRKLPEELRKSFKFESILGQGAYGVVFKIYDPSDQEHKALKLIDIQNNLDRDLEIMKELHHNNIIGYFRSGKIGQEYIFIVMELCDMDLEQALKKKILTNNDKMYILNQICNGIKYLHLQHEKQIIHRDLKPSNILLKKREVRISDFGISKCLVNQLTKTENIGTNIYMPPELQTEDGKITPLTCHDIWSLGIIIHQIFTDGKHPFANEKQSGIIENILNHKFKIDNDVIIEKSSIDIIIKGCLKKNPEERIGIETIIEYLLEKDISYKEKISPNIENIKMIIMDIKSEKAYKLFKWNNFKYYNEGQVPIEHRTENLFNSNYSDGVALTNLRLGECPTEMVKKLANAIAYNDNIITLIIDDLTFANGNSTNIEVFFDEICHSNSISHLNFDNNELGNIKTTNMKTIVHQLSKNKGHTKLKLTKSKTIKTFENFLGLIQIVPFTNISLKNNALGDGKFENIELLFDWISKKEKIESLNLENNGFGNGELKNIEVIISKVCQNKSIKNVILKNNGWIKSSFHYFLLQEAKIKRKDINWREE